jgi:hypothetical protein
MMITTRVLLAFTIVVAIVAAFAGRAHAYNISVPSFYSASLAAGTATTATSAWTASGWTIRTGGANTNLLNATGLSPYLAAAPDAQDVMYDNGNSTNNMYATTGLFTLTSGYTYTMTMNIAGPKGGASQPAVLGGSSRTGFGGCYEVFYDLTKSTVIAWSTTGLLSVGAINSVLNSAAVQNGPSYDPQNGGAHLVAGESTYTTAPGNYAWSSGTWGTVGMILPAAAVQAAIGSNMAYGDQITIMVGAGNSGNGSALDNVQLTAVPEPASLWMIVSAVPLLGAYGWRRVSKRFGRTS